jgi:undecaprenyl-diphosphatase
MDFFTVLILSFVEGITEFLPISSTGHLIIAAHLLGIIEDEFVQNFNIAIQFGAILSVLVLFPKEFFPIRTKFYLKLFVAFFPAAVIGLLFKDFFNSLLDRVDIVAWMLILGGFLLIFLDRKLGDAGENQIQDLSYKQCFAIGLGQCLAMIPGVSRAAASIFGGLAVGLNRTQATYFSFFLAVPTLSAAGLYKSKNILENFNSDHLVSLGLGLFLSFLIAALSIKFLIRIVRTHGLAPFGYYRIILGIGILAMLYWTQ